MKVLHVVPSFYPATYWGGPIYSLYGLCNALAARPGVELKVLTTDTAGPSLRERVRVTSNPVVIPPGYRVYFMNRIAGVDLAPTLLFRLWGMVGWADVVHLTAVYSFPTIPTLAVCRALGKPLVWSPRGALMRWPGATRRGVKRSWERLCDRLLDAKQSVLQVTSTEEAEASHARISRAQIEVVPNGVELPELPPTREWRPNGVLRILYVGRLHPIKGLENLLHALSQPQPSSWSLRICGAGDLAYGERLRKMSRELGLENHVTFVGHVDGAEKTNEFLSADVCILPSHSENFGMAIAESLAHAVPAIAGKGTPWSGLESHRAGMWVDNDPKALAAAIARIGSFDLEAMGWRGREWMKDEYGWASIATRMEEIYKSLVRPG